MNAYSDGWQMPTAEDVSDGELIVARWDVERTTFDVPHPDGVLDRETGERRTDGTVGDVRSIASNGVMRPHVARTASDDGIWVEDPETHRLVAQRAPSVRYTTEAGRPTGWSEQLPETSPVVLARSSSRVTRSRKGRTSFKVNKRHRFMGVQGDREATGHDWEVPPGRWSGAQLAAMAEAFVRSVAAASDIEVEPLPSMIGADTGEQLVKPVKLDRSGVVETVPSDDVLVPSDGLANDHHFRVIDVVTDNDGRVWSVLANGHQDTRPYVLASSDGQMPDVSWSNYRLPGIDDDALWDRPHVEDGIQDAYGQRKLPTRPPAAVLARTVVLSDVETDRGRRIVRGDTLPDGTQRILAPGIGGVWWLGRERIDSGAGTVRAVREASKAANAVKRETVDGWLALAVALDVGQIRQAPDGIEVCRPTPQRYEIRRGGDVLGGGRTPAAATTKARRNL